MLEVLIKRNVSAGKKQGIGLLFFLFMASCMLAQKADWVIVDGYVITKKNDTLWGELKFDKNKPFDLFKQVQFKQGKEKGQFKPQKPNAIKGFKLVDKEYESIKIGGKFVFMQVMLRGKISVYEYLDKEVMEYTEEPEFFIIKKGISNEPMEVLLDSKFKKEIAPFLSDDPEIKKESEKMPLEEKDFLALIAKYNARNPETK